MNKFYLLLKFIIFMITTKISRSILRYTHKRITYNGTNTDSKENGERGNEE